MAFLPPWTGGGKAGKGESNELGEGSWGDLLVEFVRQALGGSKGGGRGGKGKRGKGKGGRGSSGFGSGEASLLLPVLLQLLPRLSSQAQIRLLDSFTGHFSSCHPKSTAKRACLLFVHALLRPPRGIQWVHFRFVGNW